MSDKKATPFVKWAGGKTRLINFITQVLPNKIKTGDIERYIEPFVGGGSVFFHVSNNYKVKKFIINDNNFSLMASYKTIKKDVGSLINNLSKIRDGYLSLDAENKKKYYYERRDDFNNLKKKVENKRYNSLFVDFTSLFIFLNKTCYNGLFRLNSNGMFNVPFGKYENQSIFDKDNLRNVNKVLEKAKILNKDFSEIEKYVDENSFLYIDPPYRVKINNGFLLYNETIFSWKDQIKLAEMTNRLSKKNYNIMVSNANNKDVIKLYENFHINYFYRTSVIAGKTNCRGSVKELILTSYEASQSKLLQYQS